MGKANLIDFIFVQLARPIALFVQFAILARVLTPPQFAQFVYLYAIVVILSIITDLGQRQIAFAAMRRSTVTMDRSAIIGQSRLFKLFGSAVLVAALLIASKFGYLSVYAVIVVAINAVTIPISDVSAALLRGASKPKAELALGVSEQVVLSGILFLILLLNTEIDAIEALAIFGGMGLLRMIALGYLCRRELGPATFSERAIGLGAVKVAIYATLSILASVAIARMPALSFKYQFSTIDYAVFVAFWTILQRSELFIGSVIQYGYKKQSTRIDAIVASPVRVVLFAVSSGLLILATTHTLARPLTSFYLGEHYIIASDSAVLAAILIPLHLPIFALRTLMQYDGYVGRVTVVQMPLVALNSLPILFSSQIGHLSFVIYLVSLIASGTLLFIFYQGQQSK